MSSKQNVYFIFVSTKGKSLRFSRRPTAGLSARQNIKIFPTCGIRTKPGLHCCEKTPQWWQAVGYAVRDLTATGIELKISMPIAMSLTPALYNQPVSSLKSLLTQ